MGFWIDFVANYWFMILLIFILQIINVIILPAINKNKDNTSETTSYPILTFIVVILTIITFCLQVFDWKKLSLNASSSEEYDDNAFATNTSPPPDFNFEYDYLETYIVDSSHEVIYFDVLYQLTDTELRLLRNGIYAYMGRTFVEEDLRCYYKNFEWYTESISPEDFQWEMFNTYQKQTIENIKKVEAEREQLKQTN